MAPKRIFLTSTNGAVAYWPDPGDWNPNDNTVECIGAGGRGAGRPVVDAGGAGGGGGAYAVGTNLALTFPVPYCVWSTGAREATNFNINAISPSTAPGGVSAENGGTGASFDTVGAGGVAVHPTGFAGGMGGSGNLYSAQGGGGGGAGGPNGVGGAGGTATLAVGSWGRGGDANGGLVAGASTQSGSGLSGTEWGTHGVGSGGAAAINQAGGAGGAYGGGGAGGSGLLGAQAAGGAGGPGLIVITYEPLLPPPKTRVFLYAGVTSFPDPGNWNPDDNKVECVGAGGSGVGVQYHVPSGEYWPSPGGGGGGYGYDTNLTPVFPVECFFATNSYSIFNGNDSAITPMPGRVWGQNGRPPQSLSGAGGAFGLFTPHGFAGGPGGSTGIAGQFTPGGGGGGAGGPHGAGAVGGVTAGGSSDGGTVPGGAAGGGAGQNGVQWDHIHGTGSGGGGAAVHLQAPGRAGRFGGGGGGAFGQAGNTAFGAGSPGLIVITWTPLPPPSAYHGQTNIMM